MSVCVQLCMVVCVDKTGQILHNIMCGMHNIRSNEGGFPIRTPVLYTPVLYTPVLYIPVLYIPGVTVQTDKMSMYSEHHWHRHQPTYL